MKLSKYRSLLIILGVLVIIFLFSRPKEEEETNEEYNLPLYGKKGVDYILIRNGDSCPTEFPTPAKFKVESGGQPRDGSYYDDQMKERDPFGDGEDTVIENGNPQKLLNKGCYVSCVNNKCAVGKIAKCCLKQGKQDPFDKL